MNNTKKIGLFGFGTVGKGFYEILQKLPQIEAEVVKVCVKRLDLQRINHTLYFTDNQDELLDDPEIDLIIEVISDAKAAKEIVEKALKNGKSVISANKKMIGESLAEVNEWHQAYPGSFLYEAAVGGGIPIVHAMDSLFKEQGVTKIRGILNGSSNYILTQMQECNWSFEKALEEAQVNGFAEEDPSLDVDGFDASYKLGILGYHAFGEITALKSCELVSIRTISEEDIRAAKRKSQKIKPVATIEKIGNQYHCRVKPERISSSDALYNVDLENNAVSVHTNVSGVHTAIGKGAGSLPTGSAVIADLKRILSSQAYEIHPVEAVA